jgi:hypothetical protein
LLVCKRIKQGGARICASACVADSVSRPVTGRISTLEYIYVRTHSP